MAALGKRFAPLQRDDSLFLQFLLTYGTMTTIVVLVGLIKKGVVENFTAYDMWDLVVNAYSPTTITFIASLVFDHSSIKDSKRKSAICFFSVILMALTFMAFEAIYIINDSGNTLVLLGIFALAAPIFSLFVLLSAIDGSTEGNNTTSDGFASGRKEIYND